MWGTDFRKGEYENKMNKKNLVSFVLRLDGWFALVLEIVLWCFSLRERSKIKRFTGWLNGFNVIFPNQWDTQSSVAE